MSHPAVSVCLITYKQQEYVRQAIESILMQQVNFAWELIIADDNSPDDTRQIILEYRDKYPDLIKLLFQEKNVGGGQNFVDLINAAKGKYVAYLEGDDYWTDPLKLQCQFDLMEENTDLSLCYHRIKWVYTYPRNDDPDLESNVGDPATCTIIEVLQKGWFIRSCSLFFRNIKLPQGFDKLYVGDYPLHVLLAEEGKIGFIDESMGVYRINDKGISEQKLQVTDPGKRKANFLNEIYLNDYLNLATNKKYAEHFSRKKFEAIYSHLHFAYSISFGKYSKELLYVLTRFSWPFLIRQSFSKGFAYKRKSRRIYPGIKSLNTK